MPIIANYYIKLRKKPIMGSEKYTLDKVFSWIFETFEKCQFVFKLKKADTFNHPGTIFRTYGARVIENE